MAISSIKMLELSVYNELFELDLKKLKITAFALIEIQIYIELCII